ncbi:MAG: energy transducer TonB [Ginsengibacter sp.]
MQTAEILSSSFLDILFENRNKDYGAYDLRRSYNKRLGKALSILLGTLVFSATIFFLFGKGKTDNPNIVWNTPPNTTTVIIQPDKIIIPQIKAVRPMVAIKTVQSSTPLIVKDNTNPLPPPDITEIENANIGLKASTGNADIGLINPPPNIPGSNILPVSIPRPEAEDSTYIKVEIEASFPGGSSEWSKYLKKTIERHGDEFTSSDYGTCLIRFVVDKEGNVSDVKALTMEHSKLAELAVQAIKKGPRWIPAMQNGHKVNAYRTQPITMIEEAE